MPASGIIPPGNGPHITETRERPVGNHAPAGRSPGTAGGYLAIRIATRYFRTDVREPGVSPRGIAFSVASARA